MLPKMGEEDKYKENTNFYAIWVRTLLQKINTSTRKTYTIGKTVTSGDGILGSGSPNFYLNVKQILNYNRGYSRYPMLKKLEPWIFFSVTVLDVITFDAAEHEQNIWNLYQLHPRIFLNWITFIILDLMSNVKF